MLKTSLIKEQARLRAELAKIDSLLQRGVTQYEVTFEGGKCEVYAQSLSSAVEYVRDLLHLDADSTFVVEKIGHSYEYIGVDKIEVQL